MTKGHIMLYCVIAYLVCGIVAFGHSAAISYAEQDVKYRRCQAEPKAVCLDERTGNAAADGLMAAFFWPLYFSWEIQS